jgi:hypothetical protein
MAFGSWVAAMRRASARAAPLDCQRHRQRGPCVPNIANGVADRPDFHQLVQCPPFTVALAVAREAASKVIWSFAATPL